MGFERGVLPPFIGKFKSQRLLNFPEGGLLLLPMSKPKFYQWEPSTFKDEKWIKLSY